ncbi:MAG: hypothetical protein HZC37_01430 [Burkholderiales bacterium]|nr:hypothetical protein [Burkholderiales bacterium]
MFSNRRLCRWAVRVLLVWLFGLAMGVAHACALGESTHQHSTAGDAANVSSSQHDDEEHDLALANCLDFCEKSSVGVPKLKLIDDSSANSALPAAVPGHGTTEPAWESLRAGSPVASPHWHSGPPLRIAYRRLAL